MSQGIWKSKNTNNQIMEVWRNGDGEYPFREMS